MFRLSQSARRAPHAVTAGFTLQECVISLFVGGSLVLGGTSIHGLLQESAQTAAANDLIAHLYFARSEAIKRQARVAVCPSKDQKTCAQPDGSHTLWQHGWLVYVDSNANEAADPGEVLRVHEGTGRDLIIRTSRSRDEVTYQPQGMAGGSTTTFALCDSRGAKSARYVVVSNGGRARVTTTSSSNVRCT